MPLAAAIACRLILRRRRLIHLWVLSATPAVKTVARPFEKTSPRGLPRTEHPAPVRTCVNLSCCDCPAPGHPEAGGLPNRGGLTPASFCDIPIGRPSPRPGDRAPEGPERPAAPALRSLASRRSTRRPARRRRGTSCTSCRCRTGTGRSGRPSGPWDLTVACFGAAGGPLPVVWAACDSCAWRAFWASCRWSRAVSSAVFARLHPHQLAHELAADRREHLDEAVVALLLVLLLRVLLAVAAQADALAQVVHRQQVVLPELVDGGRGTGTARSRRYSSPNSCSRAS